MSISDRKYEVFNSDGIVAELTEVQWRAMCQATVDVDQLRAERDEAHRQLAELRSVEERVSRQVYDAAVVERDEARADMQVWQEAAIELQAHLARVDGGETD